MPLHKHERLAQLIGQGMKPKQAISLVGVSEAYFKRLKDDEAFTALLSSYVNPTLEDEHSLQAEAEQIEDKWAALETQAIEKALAALPMAELKDINKTLDIVAKRRVGGAMADAAKLAASNPKIQLVTLRLPETQQRAIIDAQAEVVTNSTGEVVRAGNRDLAALSTDGVTELLEFNRPQTSEYSIDPEDL